jgi:hypothetical protein
MITISLEIGMVDAPYYSWEIIPLIRSFFHPQVKGDMTMLRKTAIVIAISAAIGGFTAGSVAAATNSLANDLPTLLAKKDADDKPGDVKGEGAGHPLKEQVQTIARRGRGADDKPGDVKGEGAGHPVSEEVQIIARRGADDPAGHQRREDRRADRRST